jgi:hypothetical protein
MKNLLVFLVLAASAAAQHSFDLVVYGGTAAGAATAVSGARQGLKTALVEPRHYIGGMVSGGLSGTDVGRREAIGGMSLEFYYRAGRYYGVDRHLQEIAWMPEPKAAEAVFREMMREAGVVLFQHHRLREKNGVRKEGTRIVEIATENGARFAAKVFADASYEGDLMAQARVSYTFGRESVAQYGESLAGVRAVTPSHQFAVDIPARDEKGNLLPEISPEPRGEPGSADKRIQAYNFRVIATNVPANRVPWPKPADYDPARYELLARYLTAMTAYMGRPLTINEAGLLRVIPNGKVDLNNRGGFSTDYIGKNYGYPDGTYAERERIWKDHEDYQKGFYYFLANDPRVPQALQLERHPDLRLHLRRPASPAAIQAKKMGKSVVMVCPEKHLGGLTAGGLGFTDTGNKAVIGGLSREFYHRVWQHYQKPEAWRWQKREEYGNKGQGTEAMDQGARTMWIFEPHVAEKALRGMGQGTRRSRWCATPGSTAKRASVEGRATASPPSRRSTARPTPPAKCSSTPPTKAT